MAKDITSLKTRFANAFGTELTGEQLWAITLLAKHVRLRARNNSAFNNFMNSMFPHAQFKTVTKERINYRSGLKESYPGLSIVVKGVVAETEEEED
jgi:hypothetical protein